MNPTAAAKEMSAGIFRPVYAVFGRDRYRMREFVAFAADKLLGEEEKELGLFRFDTSETPVEAAIEEAEAMPFFVSRKLVVVRDETVLASGGGKEGRLQHNVDRLVAYLRKPCETSVLLFVVHSDKLDERRKAVRLLKEMDAVIEFAELEGRDLVRWVMRRVTQQGRSIGEETAEALIRRAGTNLQTLAAETDKLCLYAGPGGTILREHVEALTEPVLEEDVFALVDALMEGDAVRAVSLYRQLLERKEEPIRIAALIASQLRIMLQVKELAARSWPVRQIAAELGLHPYRVRLAAEKARFWSEAHLAGRLREIAELDYRMKTGQVDKAIGLELYLLESGAMGRPAGTRI
ncbi:MAG: DNA polymerase III subunit delta [Thermobacillus sp. ZCTH02-B1]|uniref:DNA polymerase III subunit delta n=1 Tax=Thermobacillus sp. ZCTH02-B1 TaxID=1858795 RepID=UPI000B54FA57|nr:DNA polymerase III subunit delta [Thermobacillus sp. ZCTH02-B1]OUM96004.1 MAG: DNA polymerase III subunit delta [Thermobacillus sp. ZCTH02-B1]